MSKIVSMLLRWFFKFRGIDIDHNINIKLWPTISCGIMNSKSGNVQIGAGCELSRGVILKAYGGTINISKNVFMGEYVTIYGHGDVTIGENTLIAMHACIVSSNHTIPLQGILIRSQKDILLPVKIGSDVWIGAGAKILGGVTIGNGCVIGAGSVVTKSLPAYSISVGVPAQITGYRHE